MAGWKCSFITESESVPGPESNTEPVATTKSRTAPNSSTNSEYQSSYESTDEPESTSESASAVELESRVDSCDHSIRTVNKVC